MKTTNTTNKNIEIEQHHEKHKYLLHSNIPMRNRIARDTCSRTKGKSNEQFSLWSWRWMGKEVQWNEKYIGTLLLPLLRWPILEPPVQKIRFRLQRFQRNLCDFEKFKIDICKVQARYPKTQNWRWARQKIILGHFFEPIFLVWCVEFGVRNSKTPFPHNSGHFSLPRHMPASDPLRPRKRSRTAKTKNPFSRASFSEGWPKTTPDISRTCCDNGCAAEPHETL